MLMVAVPNTFTRNQLENRFRADIERLLSGYFGRNIQLAVIVDESLKPAEGSLAEESTQFSESGANPSDQSRGAYGEDNYAAPDLQPEGFTSAEFYSAEE